MICMGCSGNPCACAPTLGAASAAKNSNALSLVVYVRIFIPMFLLRGRQFVDKKLNWSTLLLVSCETGLGSSKQRGYEVRTTERTWSVDTYPERTAISR